VQNGILHLHHPSLGVVAFVVELVRVVEVDVEERFLNFGEKKTVLYFSNPNQRVPYRLDAFLTYLVELGLLVLEQLLS
jgi:hypothetical protein